MFIPRAKSVGANLLAAMFCFVWPIVIFSGNDAIADIGGLFFALVLWPVSLWFLYRAVTLRVEDEFIPKAPPADHVDVPPPANGPLSAIPEPQPKPPDSHEPPFPRPERDHVPQEPTEPPAEELVRKWQGLARDGLIYAEIARMYPPYTGGDVRDYCVGRRRPRAGPSTGNT